MTVFTRIATTIPEPRRSLLVRAAATHSPTEIDAAILAVMKMYPQLFRKDAQP